MKGYLFCNTPEIIKESSSGGAFSAIVTAVSQKENQDVIVYGAAFDEHLNLVHQRYEAKEDYSSLRGSKYVFSEYNKSLMQVKEDLIKGAYVIFTGTPCQVYALKSFLDRENLNTNNLLTIDLICHGSPEKSLWRQYKEWLEKRHEKKIKSFSFRYKGMRWHGYSLMAEFEDGERIVNSHDLQVYMDLYFTHQIMRRSCYQCKFSSTDRPGDITLGDFWGIEDIFSGIITQKQKEAGVSLITVNSDKGKGIIELLTNMSVEFNWILHKCIDDSFIKYQTGLNSPTVKPDDNEAFREYMSKYGFDATLSKYAGFNLKGRIRYYIKYLANYIGLIK